MSPAPGGRLVRFVGDSLRFSLRTADGAPLPPGWQVRLRTTLGRGRELRRECIVTDGRPPLADAAWHDVPLEPAPDRVEWSREFTLTEPGFFRAKAYAMDPAGRQFWPEGPDFGLSIHPDWARSANVIYCAFTRQFGDTRGLATTGDPAREQACAALDAAGYTVIPPGGKLRDLIRQLPHIVDTLGCRILHLLPVHPTPTTMARYGRFGSPYAALDLTAIDPALVEFDRRTTGVDQFRELTAAAHARGARVFLDIVANHTGWGARLQEIHPEWYVRDDAGNFVSPGAWGVTWEDLAELDHRATGLWHEMAETFLTWCRRGVDGFRCDAGYKVPVEAWRYITARVIDEFPETVFLLEGLGGSWEATESLLNEGGMQWAYSELFQNHSGGQVAWYLDYAWRQSERVGLYVHYSETHDNDRLAAHAAGRTWSLLRNRLCALTSQNGGFGYTGGVEWLAAEKIRVHGCNGLNWDAPANIVPELGRLARILAGHPSFFDGSVLTRLSPPEAPVFAARRTAPDGSSPLLILANTDVSAAQELVLSPAPAELAEAGAGDLLGQAFPVLARETAGVRMTLPPGAVFCLSTAAAAWTDERLEQTGNSYRRARAQAAWAVSALAELAPMESLPVTDSRALAAEVDRDPAEFLSRATSRSRHGAAAAGTSPLVTVWRETDRHRILVRPDHHWLLVELDRPFRATLGPAGEARHQIASVPAGACHYAAFPPGGATGELALEIDRFAAGEDSWTGRVETCAADRPATPPSLPRVVEGVAPLVLLTNGRGTMARLAVHLGSVTSKYDCLLGANLHPTLPVDRHVLVKRLRAWLVADGFVTPLADANLTAFQAGPPARWDFTAGAGDGRAVALSLTAALTPGDNTVTLRWHRHATAPAVGRELPANTPVSVTVRLDIEDRSFHAETRRNGGADHHFQSHVQPWSAGPADHYQGFTFSPAPDRQLRAWTDRGEFHPEPEWCEGIPHPVEATRGQEASGDAYSPGWFSVPLMTGETAVLTVTAEAASAPGHAVMNPERTARHLVSAAATPRPPADDDLAAALQRALDAFVVRRDEGRTVIAGYPWFLDWGRDTLIAARGLIAAGRIAEVGAILRTFGRFEENGTLPNIIHGEHIGNRDTSDAPLWFGVVCEDMAAAGADPVMDRVGSRTLREVLESIALHYWQGTPNGIRACHESGLVWSPAHFTWMDTNYPAGTPREGYPVEIQVLWWRLVRQLARWNSPNPPGGPAWSELAARIEASVENLFWQPTLGWYADVLAAGAGVPANRAVPVNALRSNALLLVSLGWVRGDRARQLVTAAARHLVVPGALRSLAPLPVDPPQPIHAADGRALNDPANPYWPRYEGDEDSRRKPAYHNGTAWLWPFPGFCEAWALAWDHHPDALATARAYLRSTERWLHRGCLGQLPEICDGDAPHTPRGCDAQAWSASEALRVWRWLQSR